MEDRKPSRHRASEDVRRQKRKELDARRSKSRIRLGTHLEQWCHVKDQLGFHLHSDFAKFLLDSYASKSPVSGSGAVMPGEGHNVLRTSSDALRRLVVWSHDHSRECGFIPDLKSVLLGRSAGGSLTAVWECIAGHSYPWLLLTGSVRPCPPAGARTRSRGRDRDRDRDRDCDRAVKVETALPGGRGSEVNADGRLPAPQPPVAGEGNSRHRGRRRRPEPTPTPTPTPAPTPTPGPDTLQLVCESDSGTDEEPRPDPGRVLPPTVSDSLTVDTPDGNDGELEIRDESDEAAVGGSEESTDDDLSYADDLKDQNYSPSSDSSDRTKRKLQPRLRGRLSKESPNNGKAPLLPVDKPRKGRRVCNDPTEEPQIPLRKIRKKAPMEILRCEFEGCGKVVSNRQYLKHHMKYQHLLQKTFACSHPSCGRSFNFKKHLKEHEKLHSDKRDYICEFCARQFRTTSNLIIHRRIHTGEKPLQCEICGFTCRQKASLNWHMKKHDAESGYQFSCDVCGKRFEKKDNVSAHKRKSHPESPAVTVTSDCQPEMPSRDWAPLETKAEPPSQPTSP